MQWLTKVGEEEDLKEGIDIKSRLLEALDKYKRLNVTFRQPREKGRHWSIQNPQLNEVDTFYREREREREREWTYTCGVSRMYFLLCSCTRPGSPVFTPTTVNPSLLTSTYTPLPTFTYHYSTTRE